MEKDYTHILFILDRTGSMASIKDDVIGGFNTFLEQQKNGPGRATITLVQFDSQDPFEVVYSLKDVREAPPLTDETFIPRACTPLLDAMGRGMVEMDRVLAASDEASPPEHVVFAVLTDGLENASTEYRQADIRRMVDERKKKGWQFAFLSADLEAVDEAGKLGVGDSSRMAFARSGAGVRHAMHALSARAMDLRMRKALDLAFSDEDRATQEEERKKTQE